jgi:glycosyltransferase involved in cell wall biosynthesis
MSEPTLSVIMPNYNHGRYLAEAITGIATQSRPPDEFLILDDGSTDDSLQVVAPLVDRFRFIRVIRHDRNRGVIAAHQRLFAEAQSDYVLAAAADDVRLPGFFERAMRMVDRFPEAGLVFGMVRMIDEEGGHLLMGEASRWREPLYADPQRFLHEYLLVERPSQSPCSGTIYRRSAIQEVGGYRAELGSWADTFALRAIGLKYGVCYVPVEVAQFRVLAGSFSQQSDAEPRKMLDLISRAAALMRTAEFRDRFPANYVQRWRRDYRWQVIRDYFLGPEVPGHPRPSFLIRNLRRLPRVLRTLLLFVYQGDLSCYQDKPRG